jgi:predicted SprT family Zn-dependent metalloprotease
VRVHATGAPADIETRRIQLRNQMQMRFFDFSPRLTRRLTCEELLANPRALKDVTLNLSPRMGNTLGMCYPERRRIALNEDYFLREPRYLPYTLHHEMVHLFLWDAGRDWGHTREFYALMEEFPADLYPADPNVHVHARQARAGARDARSREEERAREETLTAFVARVFGGSP